MVYLTAIIVLGLVVAGVIWGMPSRRATTVVADHLRVSNARFEVSVNQDAETITVRANEAVHRTPSSQGDALSAKPVDLTFPAAGFRLTIEPELRESRVPNRRRAPRTPDVYTLHNVKSGHAHSQSSPTGPGAPQGHTEPTGLSTLVFQSLRHPLAAANSELAQDKDEVIVAHVTQAEADAFARRFTDIAQWVRRMEVALEERLAAVVRARYQAKVKAEKALSSLLPQSDFPVLHKAMDFDEDGRLRWAIQLGSQGRCWIYADGKVYQGPLAGGKATLVDDAVEVMVRDAKWETSYFSRRKMRVFTGDSRAQQQEWCDRINALAELKPRALTVSSHPDF